jgi:hypothetical protein
MWESSSPRLTQVSSLPRTLPSRDLPHSLSENPRIKSNFSMSNICA